MDEVEQVMENMDLQPDPQVTQYIFGLFSKEALLGYAGTLIKILVVVALILILRRIACHVIDKMFRNRITMTLSQKDALEEKRLHTLSKLFKSIVSYVLYFVAIISCLDMIGFSVTTIIAGAGVVSLAVAFGAQSIVQDLMSGIFIVLENQYAVGDYVQIDGIDGQVKEIGMKTTKVQTWNGELLIISNGSIGRVINYSRAPQRGYAEVGIAYEEDIDTATTVIQQACDRVGERHKDELDLLPVVQGVTALADSSVVIRVQFTILDWLNKPVVERELRKEMKEALNAANIEIAYPKVQLVK
ncbi:MAG: mechanosensitive ion channel family protein [Peptococcaceae bacterium]